MNPEPVSGPSPATNPMPGFTHFFRFLGALIAIGVVFAIISVILHAAGLSRAESTTSTQVISLGLYAWLSPKVGYRWFDTLFMLIPIYGAVYAIRILWRYVSLSHVYWSVDPTHSS